MPGKRKLASGAVGNRKGSSYCCVNLSSWICVDSRRRVGGAKSVTASRREGKAVLKRTSTSWCIIRRHRDHDCREELITRLLIAERGDVFNHQSLDGCSGGSRERNEE